MIKSILGFTIGFLLVAAPWWYYTHNHKQLTIGECVDKVLSRTGGESNNFAVIGAAFLCRAYDHDPQAVIDYINRMGEKK